MLQVSLVTRGLPGQVTGGHLYHRRMAELASMRDARIEFVSARWFRNPLRQRHGVVLVDSLVAASVTPWLIADRGRTPVAAILHQPPGGIDHGRARTALQGALDRALYRRCKLLIVASSALADQIEHDLELPSDRIHVVEPGCDVLRHEPAHELRCGRRMALLNVANWLPNKGVLELIEAVAGLPEDYITLHLVGRDDVDGRYSSRVRARLGRPDVRQRVVVHGAVPPEEIGGFYAGADAFALLSYHETYGTVYGEALAAGLPTIGWQSGNLSDLIEDGLEGRLIAPGDIPSVTATLHRLAIDVAWRNQLSAAAHRRGQRLPTWDDAADRFFDVLARSTARD